MGILARVVDSVVNTTFPQWGVKRAHARRLLKRLNSSYSAASSQEKYRSLRASAGSANANLEGSIATLRARSRHAYRNYPAARAGIEARVGLVISTGIDVEPNTGNPEHDKLLREAWEIFSEQADAAGQLHIKEFQRQAFRCEGLNGAYLIQIVTINDPTRFIPIALHAIEADQLSLEPVKKIPKNNKFSNGVETDVFGKPIRYHIISHPNDTTLYGKGIRTEGICIDAEDIIHGYEKLRPAQSTGEPIMVASLQRMVQEEDLVEAELESAKIGSAFAVAIESELQDASGFGVKEEADDDSTDDIGNELTQLTSGIIARLQPGDKANILANNRPSQAIAPFRQMLRGDIASSMKIGRVDLDKDYSEANYSSMRADQLDKKRQLTPDQRRFGRDFVSRLYIRVLPLLAAKMNISLEKKGSLKRIRQERHKLLPDGWAYVDPEKDIKAALMAIEGGLSTYRDEIGTRGGDYREIHQQLETEMESQLIKYLQAYRIKNSVVETDVKNDDANTSKKGDKNDN